MKSLIASISFLLLPYGIISAANHQNPYKFLSNFVAPREVLPYFVPSLSSSELADVDEEKKEHHHNPSDEGVVARRGRGAFIPTLLFLFAFADGAAASPLNPQAISISGPFFQGWLFRTVDHTRNGSVILIVGSFARGKNRLGFERHRTYDEHYIFCGVDFPGSCYHAHALPAADSVVVTGGGVASVLPFQRESQSNITWEAKGLGAVRLRGESYSANFKLGDLHVELDGKGRRPWAPNTRKGPEGWLGYTSLLPCHYFVHSVGSLCK